MTSNAASLLEVRDLHVVFGARGRDPVEAVRGVNFRVAAQRTCALVGESGSGKSATALSILGLLPQSAQVGGTITFEGTDLLGTNVSAQRDLRGRRIAMVFQDPMSSLNPVFPVGDQIAEVLWMHMGLTRRAARERAIELLDEVGIREARLRSAAYPHQFSGGQQQRVMIAMAIACNPSLLVADEPTTALDVTIQRQIVDLLQRLKERHRMSVLFISHDLALVSEIADDIVVMRRGVVREQGCARDVLSSPNDDYTRALLACRPSGLDRVHRLPVVADDGAFIEAREPRSRASRTDGDPIITISDLSKIYDLGGPPWRRRSLVAVDGVSFTLRHARTVGLVGESGSGKTTVGQCICRLVEPTTGSVIYHAPGKNIDLARLSKAELRPYRAQIQMVFQNPLASLNPRFTVGQLLTEPMRLHGIGANGTERIALAVDWLDRVGLGRDVLDRYPHEFSGGQRQRIAIARCLTLRPKVLVCDESVSALDVSVQAQVLNLLLDLQDEYGLAYLFISHDLSVVQHMADEIIVMRGGRMVESTRPESLGDGVHDDYTRELIAAVPRLTNPVSP